MKFSTQEEYGLRCLVQIAAHGERASLTIAQLGRFEGITVPNVAKIMRVLRRGGFVKSTRGQAGGYALTRLPREILVGDVLAALGPRLFDARFCQRHAGAETSCAHTSDCSIRPVLSQLQEAVDVVMGRLTLDQLIVSRTQRPMGPRAVGMPLLSRA
jgi:Rrf2 family protein